MSKILIVDDSEDLVEFLTYLLKANGHTIKVAFNSTTIRTHLSLFKPDLLLLDVRLPGESGRDICKAIKADPFYVHIPILLLSASPEHLENYKECKADDVLEKPFEVNTLLQKVDTLLAVTKKAPLHVV